MKTTFRFRIVNITLKDVQVSSARFSSEFFEAISHACLTESRYACSWFENGSLPPHKIGKKGYFA